MIIKLPPATIRELPNGWLRKETGQTYKHAFGAERAIRRQHRELTRCGFSVLQVINWEPTTRAGDAAARLFVPQSALK